MAHLLSSVVMTGSISVITHSLIAVAVVVVDMIGGVQMAAQMKQLEQKLMALREELRDREAKARQAESSVQDLKLQLEDLQVCQPATLVPISVPRLFSMSSLHARACYATDLT